MSSKTKMCEKYLVEIHTRRLRELENELNEQKGFDGDKDTQMIKVRRS